MIAGRVDRWAHASPRRAAIADKVFPSHWSFLLGEIALYTFVVLLGTGTYLAFLFDTGSHTVVYDGPYEPLRGVPVSDAYASVLDISFEHRLGLLIRQTHHWAALVFVAAIAIHAARVFFTGAFRRPRRLTWVVGVVLLMLVLASGFSGYSLPDDLLGGMGLRVAYTVLLSIPVVGTRLAFLLFGGEFPSDVIIWRLFVLHVFVLPVLIAGAITAHLVLVWRRTHTQFPGPGRTEDNVVGNRVWPAAAGRSLAMLGSVVAVLLLLGGLVQVNPVWLYGPFDPVASTVPAQPVWFLAWVEGALRVMPPFKLVVFDHEIPNPFFPGVLLPAVVFAVLLAWPFIDARLTRDHGVHHLAEAPSMRPGRTAFGAASVSLLCLLLLSASNDVQADAMNVSVTRVTWAYRLLVLFLPPVVGLTAWKIARDRRSRTTQ